MSIVYVGLDLGSSAFQQVESESRWGKQSEPDQPLRNFKQLMQHYDELTAE